MDDKEFGREDTRGNWAPDHAVSYGPAFDWPPDPKRLVKWLLGFPGYFLPWNLFYAVMALVLWTWFTPSLEVTRTLAPGWIAYVLLRNEILALLVFGAWHLWLYRWRKQGAAFKYNRQFPRGKAPGFAFGNQTWDNMFYTLVSGVPIWTGYEVLLLWAYGNGWAPMISFAAHPIGFVALFLLVPLIHEVGFYFCHRLLHVSPLYELAHKLHHRNINPGPWSGLSMHPIEHLIYFSTILLFFVIPAHPVHMINLASRLGVAPAQGHTGFDRVVLGEKASFEASYYAHYLHHKYFEVNYSDGMVPLDRWFGSFHDGTPEAHEAMKARRMRRSA